MLMVAVYIRVAIGRGAHCDLVAGGPSNEAANIGAAKPRRRGAAPGWNEDNVMFPSFLVELKCVQWFVKDAYTS